MASYAIRVEEPIQFCELIRPGLVGESGRRDREAGEKTPHEVGSAHEGTRGGYLVVTSE